MSYIIILRDIYLIDLDSAVMVAKMDDLKYYRPDLHGLTLEKIKADESLEAQFFSNFARSFRSSSTNEGVKN